MSILREQTLTCLAHSNLEIAFWYITTGHFSSDVGTHGYTVQTLSSNWSRGGGGFAGLLINLF